MAPAQTWMLALTALLAVSCRQPPDRVEPLDRAWQLALRHAESTRASWTPESVVLYAWAAEIDGSWATPSRVISGEGPEPKPTFDLRFASKAAASLPALRRLDAGSPSADPGVPVVPEHRVHDPDTIRRSDQCLELVVGCSITPSCLEFATSSPASGYLLTHQALYLNLLRGASCRAPKSIDLDAVLADKARAMAAETVVDSEFSDLFVERLALIYMSGFPELVEPESISEVLNHQLESGAFRDPEIDACSDCDALAPDRTHQHIHGLSVLVLAYARAYLERPKVRT